MSRGCATGRRHHLSRRQRDRHVAPRRGRRGHHHRCRQLHRHRLQRGAPRQRARPPGRRDADRPAAHPRVVDPVLHHAARRRRLRPDRRAQRHQPAARRRRSAPTCRCGRCRSCSTGRPTTTCATRRRAGRTSRPATPPATTTRRRSHGPAYGFNTIGCDTVPFRPAISFEMGDRGSTALQQVPAGGHQDHAADRRLRPARQQDHAAGRAEHEQHGLQDLHAGAGRRGRLPGQLQVRRRRREEPVPRARS